MSPIGRVFIVLNLVLSGVFLGYAGFYLREADSFKKQKEEVEKRLNTEITALKADVSELGNKLSSTTQDRDAQTALASRRLNEIEAKNDEIKDLQSRHTTLQSALQGLQASYGTLASESSKQNERIEELSNNYLAANKERLEAQKARDDMAEELETERTARRNTDEEVKRLEGSVAEANTKIKDMELWQDAAYAAVPNLAEILSGTLPPVTARVARMNRDLGTVVLSLEDGAIDQVSTGWRFAVHGNGKYKGDVSIIHVDPKAKFATGRILFQKADIAINDAAETRLTAR